MKEEKSFFWIHEIILNEQYQIFWWINELSFGLFVRQSE
jgi:hypothetical protein